MKMYYVNFTAIGSGSERSLFVFGMRVGRTMQYTFMQLPSEVPREKHFSASFLIDNQYACGVTYRAREEEIKGLLGVENSFQIREGSFVSEEMPRDTLQWFRRELPYLYREVLSSFACNMYGGGALQRALVRLQALVDLRNPRGAGGRTQSVSYHGSNLNSGGYNSARQKFKLLGAHVATAIKDKDSSELDDFLMASINGSRYLNPTSIVRDIKEVLDGHGVDSDVVVCDCGHLEWSHDSHEVGSSGDTWCDSCFRDDAVYVQDRDEYWPRDDAYYHERDDEYYSYEEGEDDDPDSLMDYSTNVLDYLSADTNINSSPHGDFLMGVEFELQTSDNHRVSDGVDDVRRQLGSDYCVCKSDGSIGYNGFEIVTAPRGLAEHIKRFKGWEVKSHYRAWDTRCCGLHVHIDSHAFTQMILGKFIMLINSEKNVDFIRQLAGRHPNTDNQAREYCANEHQEYLSNPKQAVKGKSSSRYRMVNTTCLCPSEAKRLGVEYVGERSFNTIELRIFRASLNKSRLLAQIEFTHACVYFCRVASWRELDRIHFIKWLATVSSSYPHLADWYGVRRRNTKVTAESQCRDKVDDVESV